MGQLPVTAIPPARPPIGVGSISDRLLALEENVTNLQANQSPQAFRLGDLVNTRPLQSPADGDVPTWSRSRGLWVPA